MPLTFDDLEPLEQPADDGSLKFDELVPTQQEGMSFDDIVPPPTFASESRKAIVSGLRRAAESSLNFVDFLAEPLEERFPLGSVVLGPEGVEHRPGFTPTPDIPEVDRPQTTPGRIGEGAVQFLAPMGALGKAGKMMGIGKASTKLGRLAQVEAAAVGAEQIAFDPHEERLSNLIEQFPAIQNPVTEYLSADPEDTEVEARTKMGLEALGVGAVVNTVMGSLKALRNTRKANPPPPPPDIPAPVAKAQESRIILSTNITKAKEMGKVPNPRPMPEKLPPNLNIGRIESTDDVIQELQRIEVAEGGFAEARRGVVSHEETRRLSNMLGMTEEDLLKRRSGQAFNSEQALKARTMLMGSGERLVAAAKQAQTGQGLYEYQRELARHVAIQEQVAGVTAEAGRLLNQFNIIARSPEAEQARAIEGIINMKGGSLQASAKQIARLDTPEAIANAARESMKPRFMDKVIEVWINSLLSGPQTHAVNMLSNALTAAWTVPEHLLAAGIGAFRKGTDKVFVREIASRAYGMVAGGKDGAIAAWEAIKDPASVPIAGGTKLEIRPTALGDTVFGKIVNVPGRLLSAEDRFFQGMSYRMELQTRAMHSGLEKGLKGRDLARHIRDTINNPPDALKAEALDVARYQTFTNPTGPVAGAFTKAADRYPALRFITPFIRTPVNILKFANERTPLGIFSERYKTAVAKGGREADIARARVAMGSGFGAAITNYAMEGHITGHGPTDPDARAAWRKTHQPYSVRVGDEWVSFQRIEPLGVLMGIAADFSDVIREVGADDPEVARIGASITAAITNNLTSKTFLKGMSDMVRVFNDPDRYGEDWIKSYAGTVVPTGIAQIARIADPILRDTQTVLDRICSRTPGCSKTLPARIDLYGESIVLEGGVGPDIISPLWTSRIEPHPVAEEMQRLKVKIGKPERDIRGVDLDPFQYHDYAKTAGTASTQAAEALIATPFYQALPDGLKGEQLKDIFLATRKVYRNIFAAQEGILVEAVENTIKELTK